MRKDIAGGAAERTPGHLAGLPAEGSVGRGRSSPRPSPPLQLTDAGAVVTVGSRVAKLHHSYVTASQAGREAKGEPGGGRGERGEDTS